MRFFKLAKQFGYPIITITCNENYKLSFPRQLRKIPTGLVICASFVFQLCPPLFSVANDSNPKWRSLDSVKFHCMLMCFLESRSQSTILNALQTKNNSKKGWSLDKPPPANEVNKCLWGSCYCYWDSYMPKAICRLNDSESFFSFLSVLFCFLTGSRWLKIRPAGNRNLYLYPQQNK